MLQMLISGMYQIPILVGYGQHWELAEEESRLLAQQLDACLATLPSKSFDKAAKFITGVAPWISLTTTAAVLTYVRIKETGKLAGYRGPQRVEHTPADAVSTSGRPSVNGSDPLNGAASGVVSPRMSNLFEQGK